MGADVSGVVVAIGTGATRSHAGDRVVAYALGYDKASTGAPEGAFQAYVVVNERFCSPLPRELSFADASVLPLACTTAFLGLFGADYLALPLPTAGAGAPRPAPDGPWVLIWGGSTSVGCNAVQLAVAAGCRVVATASPRNFALVEGLGAARVFDYRSATVKQDIIAVLRDSTCAGAVAIGGGSAAMCYDIISAVPAVGRRFVAEATIGEGPPQKGGLAMVAFVANMLATNMMLGARAKLRGVSSKLIVAQESDGPLWDALFRDFLPMALAQGDFKSAPVAEVYGHGLEALASGLETLKAGVSAKKLVVILN